MKTSENLWISDVFRGYRNRTLRNSKDSIEWKILQICIKILFKGDKMKLPLKWMNFSDRFFITTKWHLLNVMNIEKKILKMFKSRY